MPKALASEKMPEPTTFAVNANSESLWIDGVPVIRRPRGASVRNILAGST